MNVISKCPDLGHIPKRDPPHGSDVVAQLAQRRTLSIIAFSIPDHRRYKFSDTGDVAANLLPMKILDLLPLIL
jgi:uncharacterized protein YigA (DUF484 family)